ncbi:MAG: protein kinase family protein [Lentisphaeria bacterium]|nr:protein kinase family protein [Lentisphaeria bacterium]
MLLPQLSEKLPVLCGGAVERDRGFAAFASELGRELAWLETHPVQLAFSGFCPRELLESFSPSRRSAVLCGAARYDDWLYAAARRMLGVLHGVPVGKADVFSGSVLTGQGTGPAAFVRGVLNGGAVSAEWLEKPLTLAGIGLARFIASGSTSLVYLTAEGKRAVKIAVPGAEGRFRRELAVMVRMDHPALPRPLAAGNGETPYCLMELYRTGRPAVEALTPEHFRPALDCLHGHRMIHGDIRFSNLGIRRDGGPVLLDFSHARYLAGAALSRAAAAENAKLQSLWPERSRYL